MPGAVPGGGDREVIKTIPVIEKLQLSRSFPHSSLSQVTQAFANSSPICTLEWAKVAKSITWTTPSMELLRLLWAAAKPEALN